MAQQIKKKFIGPDQIDGSKIKLLEGQSIRGTNSLGEEVDLVKIGSQDNVEVLGQEVALKSELDQENVRAVAEELRLAGLISAEEAARIADVADLQSKIDFITENTDPEALDSLKEIVEAFQSADGDLQTSITNLSTTAANDRAAIRQEFADADAALDAKIDGNYAIYETEVELLRSDISANSSAIAQEILDREATDESLDARIVPMEDILEFQKSKIYENNLAVIADGQAPVEDSQLRDGWYYENLNAGEKINWYFFDGVNQANIQKQDFSAYAVVTFDSISSLPILAVYTLPTGTNDVMPGFAHSRYIYSNFSQTPVVGKKYLIHIGDAPAIFPELPRIQVNLTNSQGDQLPTEQVFTVSFGTNSGASVGNVKLVAEHLGVNSPSYKGNAELAIRPASLVKLQSEEAARIAADAALQAQIDALDTNFVTEEELATAVSGIQSQIDGLDSRLDDIEPKVSTLESEMDAVQDELISLDSRLDTLEAFGYDQIVYVSKNGLDTNTGKQHSPFLTITAAQDSILDASPSKRYIIKVAPGSYTETSLALKANVFIVGEGQKEAVRITGALSLGPSFTANSSFDHRSGASNVTFLSAANFDWNAVQSAAGKLYFNETVFGSTLSMNGYNNAIAQAQFNSCVIFGAFTVSGINVGVFTNNVCYGNVTLNQHPNGGMVTTLSATGGYCSGTVRLTSTVNDFNKRCSVFLRGFWSENLISDGPVSYADVDLTSGSKQGAQTLNGGQVIPLNPVLSHDLRTQMIQPRSNNAHNSGDWGNQWFFNFAYVYASSGTDMYISTVGSSYDPAGDDAGRTVFIDADGYGLKPDVNGGNVQISTATTSGTGVRGKVILNGREVDVTSKQIKNLADGTLATDAVNKGQLDAAIGAIPQITFNKESKTVDATIISNEYIDLAFEAKANSIVMFVGRLAMIEGSDYSVSVVGGVSRITFLSPMLVPSPEALELGDIIHVTYAK